MPSLLVCQTFRSPWVSVSSWWMLSSSKKQHFLEEQFLMLSGSRKNWRRAVEVCCCFRIRAVCYTHFGEGKLCLWMSQKRCSYPCENMPLSWGHLQKYCFGLGPSPKCHGIPSPGRFIHLIPFCKGLLPVGGNFCFVLSSILSLILIYHSSHVLILFLYKCFYADFLSMIKKDWKNGYGTWNVTLGFPVSTRSSVVTISHQTLLMCDGVFDIWKQLQCQLFFQCLIMR